MKRADIRTGIVLAGGEAKRMGTDKGLVSYGGRPLIQYAIDLLRPFCSRILISSNNAGYERFGFEMVRDEFSGAGPMAGIASCLTQSATAGNLVVSCDMPLIEPVVIETILELGGEYTFIVPASAEGKLEPQCAYYSRDSVDKMVAMIHNKSFRLTGLFSQAPARFIYAGDYPVEYNSRWFTNINTPDDLR